jgi:hypothetical protein
MLKVAASLEDGLVAGRTDPARGHSDPSAGAKLTLAKLTRLLVKAGRIWRLTASAEWLHQIFAAESMRQPAQVEAAFARQALALLAMLDTADANAEELAEATGQHYDELRAFTR